MGRKKGTTKTGGRQKGTPNKATATLKEWINTLLDASTQIIEKDLLMVEPYQRLQFFEKLIAYVVPKQTQTQLDAQIDVENNYVPIPAGMTKEEINNLIKHHLRWHNADETEIRNEIKRLKGCDDDELDAEINTELEKRLNRIEQT